MGLRKWLGIDRLETENEVLRNYIKSQNETINSIYSKAIEYKGRNCAVAHIGFAKIEQLTLNALDNAAEKEIELARLK